jgi:hypothetical protein
LQQNLPLPEVGHVTLPLSGCLDHRPPFLELSFLIHAERVKRLLVAGRSFGRLWPRPLLSLAC